MNCLYVIELFAGGDAGSNLEAVVSKLRGGREPSYAICRGIPTLVIHGEADQIVPIQAAGHRTAKLVKGAKLAAIKDGPHAVNWTHADEVNPS